MAAWKISPFISQALQSSEDSIQNTDDGVFLGKLQTLTVKNY